MPKQLYKFGLRDDLLIAVLFFIVYKLFATPLFTDPDVAWHIEAGNFIIKNHYIPEFDIWSYAPVTQVWYNISWLWDIFASLADRALGLNALQSFNALLYAFLLVALYHSLSLWDIQRETKFVTTCVSGFILWDYALFRPQLAALYLLLLLNVLLKLFRDRRHLIFLGPIPLLLILWANIHGSFILAIGLLSLHIIDQLRLGLPTKWQLLILLLSFFGTFINPYHAEVYYAVLRTMHSQLPKYIMEWRPFTFGVTYGSSLAVALYILISFSLRAKQDRRNVIDRAIAAICLFASLISIRYFAILAILGAPYMAQSITSYVERQRNHSLLQIFQPLSLLFGLAFAAYIMIYGPHRVFSSSQSMPVDEIEYVGANYTGASVFASYNIGGYITYYGQGRFRHFIDGRAGTAFSEDVISDYLKFHDAVAGWEQLFSKYPADAAIISHDDLKRLDISSFFNNWKCVYSGKYGKVFISPPRY